MTPKCGRIDVKYTNRSYHTRMGPGKWTHDPTLPHNVSGTINEQSGKIDS